MRALVCLFLLHQPSPRRALLSCSPGLAWDLWTEGVDLPGASKVRAAVGPGPACLPPSLPPSLYSGCTPMTLPLSPSDSVSLAYQRVQKVDCTSLRPVLILGPLLDVVKEMLVNEAPGKFCRCPLGKGHSRCQPGSVHLSPGAGSHGVSSPF